MIDLDNIATYEQLDPSTLHRRLDTFPEQCRQAWAGGDDIVVPSNLERCTEIIVAGMGGSAIAGDLVSDLAGPVSRKPVRVVRDFRISGLLADQKGQTRQLVIVCSFSGETEETLSMLVQAQSEHVPTIVITGGGTLGARAAEIGVPVIAIDAPGEPRSAVGYNLMLLTSLLTRLGAIKVSSSDVLEGLAAAENMVSQVGIHVPTAQNRAKQLAKQLIGGLTVVYGSRNLSGMALRWKSQINENGKSWAFAESLPELLHNSVESFPGGPEVRQLTTAVLLKPYRIEPELERRYTVLGEILERYHIKNHVITAVPGGSLTQSLSMMVLGDYTSYYMGLLNGFDPSKTPSIDLIKDRLFRPGAG